MVQFSSNTTAKESKKQEDKLSFKEQLEALNNLPKFFKLIWETSSSLTLLNILFRVLKSAIPLSMLYVGKLIIDEVIRIINDGAANNDLTYLWTIVGIELVLAVSSDLISRAISLCDSLLGDLFSNNTSMRLIEHAAKLDLFQFEDSGFYDKLERARRQTVGRVILMSQVLSQMQDIITILFLGGGLIAYNPWLIVILIVAVIPLFVGETHFNERTYSLTRSWTPERRELDYIRYVGASDETAKEIKIFSLSDFLSNRFKFLSDKYYKVNKSLATKRAIWGIMFATFGTLAYYFAYVFILLSTIAGRITVGDLTFLAGSFNRMRNLLQMIMSRFSSIAESSLYLRDFFDFMEIEPRIVSVPGAIPFPEKLTEGFRFENVSFKYPGSKQWALKDVSFCLNAGEKIALVGENGAGKTTLVKLLARLYDPTEGRILLDGVDIRQIELNSLRSQIGIIFQDYVRFHFTASDNIAVGNIDEIKNKTLIEDSAQKSLADTVIEKLPGGYNQILGKRFESGIELSGGEWQKIALARAYMRDAQLLILDEPTSALDARAEHQVFLRFSELISGKSAVLISHRFSTVRMADRIVFLENGKVKEIGSHDQLIKEGGKYAELFNLQASGYS